MGFFDSVARAFGSFGPLSDEEIAEEHEALRLRYVAGEDDLYDELHRYDDEMTRRANEASDRENPNPSEPRHREHGWYLSNND